MNTQDFIDRVDRLEKRFKGDPIDKFTPSWLMPKEMMKALRDKLKAEIEKKKKVRAVTPMLFDIEAGQD